MSEHRYAYVGLTDCGCLVAGTVDDPERRDRTAEDVAEFIRGGLRIERRPLPITLRRCAHRVPGGADGKG